MTRAMNTALTLALLAVGAATACSGGVKAVALPSNRPGVLQYRVECDKDIERCREKAFEACGGNYEILQSSGHPVNPERITTAPGPVSTGPNFARPSWVGELIVECGRRPFTREPVTASTSPRTPPLAPTLGPGQVCVPGVTQLCLGPAACRGAQACLADGRAFGACDCGSGPGAVASGLSTLSRPGEADAGPSPPHSD